MEYKLLNWHRFGDERGSLVALEGCGDIPFAIKRVLYICNSSLPGDFSRGCADAKASAVLLMLKGSCIININDGTESAEIKLDNPTQGLFLPPLIWTEVRSLSDKGVLAVIYNQQYNAGNHIDNYEDYLKSVVNVLIA